MHFNYENTEQNFVTKDLNGSVVEPFSSISLYNNTVLSLLYRVSLYCSR